MICPECGNDLEYIERYDACGCRNCKKSFSGTTLFDNSDKEADKFFTEMWLKIIENREQNQKEIDDVLIRKGFRRID
jgi:predicted amidophosphoribosyltransferase